jgi:hypothetical protein
MFLQKHEPVTVKFIINRRNLKKLQKISRAYNQPVFNDKKFFKWRLIITRLGFDNVYPLQIVGSFNEKVLVSNVKLWKINCGNSKTDLKVDHSDGRSWLVQNAQNFIFSDGCQAPDIEIRLSADLYLREPLQSMISNSALNLFENAKYSDLNIISGGQTFRVHKAILMEKSPVFEAMVLLNNSFNIQT